MLIKHLCDYYDVIEKNSQNNEKCADFFSEQYVHFMIMLTEEGDISNIIDIRETETILQKNGKEKTVLRPVIITLPKRSQKTGIDLNIIEHRPLYIFGLNYEKGSFTTCDKTDKARKSHRCFAEGNLKFCKELSAPIVKAFCKFIEKWDSEEQTRNPHLLSLGNNYSMSYFCFALDGHPEIKLHEDVELLSKYVLEYSKTNNLEDVSTAMCPIEGEILPVARIHEKIKGIKGGNSTGGVLVGVKENAFESYGKTQSYNSNISEKAMKKYTVALNKLVADHNHRIYLDDMTIIFFAMSEDDSKECDLFSFMMNGNPEDRLNESLKAISDDILQGRSGNLEALKINANVLFCVAGLTPNSSRISQKFFIRNSFGKIMENIMQHQKDFSVEENNKQIAIWQINKQLVSPKSSDPSTPSTLKSAMFYAILNGTRYPEALLEAVIRRVKTDSDEENKAYIKINDKRIGIIKACLNRKARLMNKEEVIKMALDLNNSNPAYLCGRLFAVLEVIQQRAANGKLNRTIKDSFFASACSKPSTVFPRLIMLAQNHLAKLEKTTFYNSMIGEITDQLRGEFPQTMSLDEQGQFIIGYYQQNKALYERKTEQLSNQKELSSELLVKNNNEREM